MDTVITRKIYSEVLEKTFSPSLKRWSQSKSFMQIVSDKIVYDLGLIAPVAANVRQRVIIAVEEELKRESQPTK